MRNYKGYTLDKIPLIAQPDSPQWYWTATKGDEVIEEYTLKDIKQAIYKEVTK